VYIGNTPNNQAYTPAVDFFSGNASTTVFTLSRPVASTYQMLVVVANVTQNPGSAYTVSGNTITFASAPPSGTNNIWVQYTSLLVQVIVPTNSYQVTGPVYTGTSAPLGGATNPITGSTGSANNYIQTYIYNTFNGANSSADFSAYPNNGNDASGWVDMGITSSTYNNSSYTTTGANEGYLLMSAPSGSGTTGNLVIATDSTGTSNAIQFYTGGFGQAKSAYSAQITSTGVQLGSSKYITFSDTSTQTSTSLGYSPQTWTSVTGSRALGTTYTNSTGRPIFVFVMTGSNTVGYATSLTVSSVVVFTSMQAPTTNYFGPVCGVVPVGATYSVATNGGSGALNTWVELR